MGHARIGALLKESMGLDVASVGEASIDRATRTRMAACNVSDLAGYASLLAASPGELQELIESVVVPETWFFRNAESFRALARIVREEWIPTHPAGCLRALSFPCSTGEEPYSIAITLMEANLPPERFCVDGFDISAHALASAAKGVYGSNSFRGTDSAFRERYFRKDGNTFTLIDDVRSTVTFAQHNVILEDFGRHTAEYDVIFCRNLLIYFDPITQQRVLGKIASELRPDGVLFAGPAESFQVTASGFASIPYPQAFGFRKVAALPTPGAPKAPRAVSARQTFDRRPTTGEKPRNRRAREVPVPLPARLAVEHHAEPDDAIASARRMADAGNLTGALELVKQTLSASLPSAEGYHTLGLIRDAMGDSDQAVESYRKALYLRPDYVDSLIHLALLLEQKGDDVAAQRLRDRAQRIEERTTP
jgi:chemotaxis protein methyltransferase WspC